MKKKNIIRRIRKFLRSIESEEYNDLPKLQIEAKFIRWGIEEIFIFPEDKKHKEIATSGNQYVR